MLLIDLGIAGDQAALDMGDCYAYACAKASGAKLLFKGEDIMVTDICAAR